ncbi:MULTISPECIES: alpha-amylase family glycosyl hydrolase [unclassified Schlesneria]|uniref:alpha-amylase family glycosyl hydrolase n=1 Tax=Schlesneria TaxID=656899 RepID=UPI0035A159A7
MSESGPTHQSPSPMGATVENDGVTFRVWAPHAQQVSVVGTFNDWNGEANPLVRDEADHWSTKVANAKFGDEYRFRIINGDQELLRIDPYAREVTNSIGNGVISDRSFDWEGDAFVMPPRNELVIYEMHIGTYNPTTPDHPGGFEEAIEKFDHLVQLGVNAIEVMPTAEFAGDYSWGYNPAHIFAVETTYGGPRALKQFVKEAHRRGIAVILDVVYNHFGPSDLDLWQFDGWSENDGGGIYFYNDWRAETPWGRNRPDYGRKEVRRFIEDNANFWLEDFHLDGLRYDMTLFIRTVRGDSDPQAELPDGWNLIQGMNGAIRAKYPAKLLIAEDLQNNDWLTKDPAEGGAGFHLQWDAQFVHPIRATVTTVEDQDRSLDSVISALLASYNGDPFQRVIYSESHDEVANGKQRVPSEIDPEDPGNYFAKKRSTLAAGLVFTAAGVPMLFQGQEFLEGGWFQDTVPLDWAHTEEYSGIVRLYRDLIRLRLNQTGKTRGLCGSGCHVFHSNPADNLLAFHRWYDHGPGDDVIVVLNLANEERSDYLLGFPAEGTWKLRLNSDWKGYSADFANIPSSDVTTQDEARDGYECSAPISIGPYSMLIFSQDA